MERIPNGRYTKKFREEAVKLVTEDRLSVPEVSRRLDLPKSTIMNWARSLDELQEDVGRWVMDYNTERTHSGKYCYGKTPMQAFMENKKLALEKQLNQTEPTPAPFARVT